jgi:hypothetical protein
MMPVGFGPGTSTKRTTRAIAAVVVGVLLVLGVWWLRRK